MDMDYIIVQEVGSVLWPENINTATRKYQYPVQTASIAAGGYQYCVFSFPEKKLKTIFNPIFERIN
ncbi:hypothetical protein Avbf_12290 [Armadillidium vulgare]|nr:hypothetical protein Avbf_12290 [Armadillidium vulgare]